MNKAAAYAAGQNQALSMLKVSNQDYGMIGRFLHRLYDTGSAGLLGAEAGMRHWGNQAADLTGNAVSRHLRAAPSAAAVAGKTFHGLGGTKALAELTPAALAAYGGHQLYKNHVEPAMEPSHQAPMHPAPYAGMF